MSRSPLPEGARLVVVLGLLPVLLAACVKPDAPGVTVKGLTADIVFGVKDPKKAALPPGAEPDDTPGVFTADVPFDLPELSLSFKPLKGPTTKLGKAKPECAPTPAGKFPDKAVEPRTAPGVLPAAGLYRYVRKGEAITYPSGAKKVYDTFEQRAVQNVKVITYTGLGPDPAASGPRYDFSYETLQPSLDNKSVLTTKYEVHNETLDADVNSPAGAQRAGAGDPERGLVVKGYKKVSADKNQNNLGDSSFSPGLLIAPLEIRPGETWESSASDKAAGLSIRVTGKVDRPVQVLTCGDVVAGYFIKTVWTIKPSQADDGATSTSYTRYYDFVYAPQLGGLIVEEQVREDTRSVQQCNPTNVKAPKETPGTTLPTGDEVDPKQSCQTVSNPAASGVASNVVFRLGQIKPDPVVNKT